MTQPLSNEHTSTAANSPTVDQSHGPRERSSSLTQVSLAFVDQRINIYLRFGRPYRQSRIDRWQRRAWFVPGALFSRVFWQANDYGTTRWQVMVLQTCRPLDVMQSIHGVLPGARILLQVEGQRRVRLTLAQIDLIEALGIDPSDVSPAYWQTLGNRIATSQPLPIYSAERHAAWLAARALT